MGLPQLPDALPIPKGAILHPENPYFISPERPVMRIELCFTCLAFSLLPASDSWISRLCEPDILRLFRNSLNNSYTTCQINRSCANELTYLSLPFITLCLVWGNLFADIMQSLICMLHIPDQTAIYNVQYTYYILYLVVRGISVKYPLQKGFCFVLSVLSSHQFLL